MSIRYLNRSRGSIRAFDADVLAWRDAVVANGGSVSLARLIVVDQFVYSEKSAGAWALTDDYWGLWAENEIQALTSLKQRRLATAVNSPTFTPDRGYAFDGLTNYINTSFVPSTHAVAMTTNTQRIAAYERSNVSTSSTSAMGARTNSSNRIENRPMGGTQATGILSGSVANFTLSPADSRGLFASSLTGATTILGYKNGVRLTDVTGLTITGLLPTVSFYIGGTNQAGVYTFGRAASEGWCAVGAQLSDAQEVAQYANVQAWATAVGAQV